MDRHSNFPFCVVLYTLNPNKRSCVTSRDRPDHIKQEMTTFSFGLAANRGRERARTICTPWRDNKSVPVAESRCYLVWLAPGNGLCFSAVVVGPAIPKKKTAPVHHTIRIESSGLDVRVAEFLWKRCDTQPWHAPLQCRHATLCTLDDDTRKQNTAQHSTSRHRSSVPPPTQRLFPPGA